MDSNPNKPSQPFLIVLLTVSVLFVASLINNKLIIGDYETKVVDPFSEILLIGASRNAPLPSQLINDSIIAQDSAAFALRQRDPTNIVDFITDSSTTLTSFFEALNATKKNGTRTRIAYFGDSMIEGDLISQDLRSLMQDRFGGHGVGYVPITSLVAHFRKTIKHKFKGWENYNFFTRPAVNHRLGISGYGFEPEMIDEIDKDILVSDAWVKYKAVDEKHLDRFYTSKLLYGKTKPNNDVVINNKRYELDGKKRVNQLVINHDEDSLELNAYFQCTTPTDIYGFSFESEGGVLVDNYSFRGNSGLPNYRVSKNVYSGTNECLEYDLIILQYGLNAVAPHITKYDWYEAGMNNVIRHIKASFPGVSILMISVGDKSYENNEVFITDPSVPILLETQKEMIQENQLAFWSMYDAMGGYNSMVQWVEGDTAFAKKDYAHFNVLGAHKMGEMLFGKLMGAYKDYYKKQVLTRSAETSQ